MVEANDQMRKARDVRFFVVFGFGVATFMFGGLLLWSLFAPIDGAVLATGQVVVESNRKAVQHLEGGVIGAILVREGDTVEAGQTVARLDNTMQKANVALIDSQLTEQYARRARLEAERDGNDMLAKPRGNDEILQHDRFKEKIDGQKALFTARRSTLDTKKDLLQQRIVQQKERITGLNVQLKSMQQRLLLTNDELKNIRDLHAKGFVANTRLMELEQQAKHFEGERGSLRADIAEAQSVISEATLEIEGLSETTREEVITELRDTEVSIAELEERRITAIDALRRAEIKAPQSGRVLGLAVHTVGGVIGAGAPLMEIVPMEDKLQISARIASQDVDKVHVGQETLLRFSAFGSSKTPEADGRVRIVSADSKTDEITGEPYYLVEIEMPQNDILETILDGKSLLPGMPVEAFISTGSKSAISYLLKPLTDSFARSMRED